MNEHVIPFLGRSFQHKSAKVVVTVIARADNDTIITFWTFDNDMGMDVNQVPMEELEIWRSHEQWEPYD